MDKESFLKDYIRPSEAHFNEHFRLPLPAIPGMKKTGEFIVQGSMEDTCSTNIITKYETNDGIRFVEVYKNTENITSGVFIRLAGTMSLVKQGYPFVILDAAVSNVSPFTFQKESPATRVALHLPQAESDLRNLFFESLNKEAGAKGIASAMHEVPALPAFWGQFWSAQLPGIAFEKIAALRAMVWRAYDGCCGRIPPQEHFDYGPAWNQIVFKNARAEHHIFKKMGLSVAVEAQAAFFSMLVAGA